MSKSFYRQRIHSILNIQTPKEFERFLTELPDPESKLIYFIVANPNGKDLSDDELFGK